VHQLPNILPRPQYGSRLVPSPGDKPLRISHPARPAQLEAFEVEYSNQHPSSAFRTTKKVLDALYMKNRKRPAPQANLQLSRFLADEDVVRPSIEESSGVVDLDIEEHQKQQITAPSRRKKKTPKRLDAGAAKYRQPSNPLILDFLVSAEAPNSEGRKLLGLGKYGTNYPVHFDVFPLQPGIFFHESTFIGSGRFSEIIGGASSIKSGDARPRTSLKLAGKIFCWGCWNEDVSSDIGICFDWLQDQLLVQDTSVSSPPVAAVPEVMNFVVEYVQHHVSFVDDIDIVNFLTRMSEVLQDFSCHLDKIGVGGNTANGELTKRRIEVLSMSTLLSLQLLQKSRHQLNQSSLVYKFEDLLKVLASHCVGLLLFQDLDGIRKLYDDLQYLSFREDGIKNDQYALQAWLIVLQVMQAARIPRGSFWDVTNSQFLGNGMMMDISDARVMEKLWYSMFSLLPLCEFDEFGVVVGGLRHTAGFDNWTLPQLLLKRVFTLYTSNQRQSPGFNDYCRSIVSRCHHLMVEWGWWRSSGVIGALFDFFAAQSLSHLRNEEVYTSPHFLEELDAQPSLSIEPEDRCFHVFLKIVALEIRHLRKVGDTKGARNLVARLLPNHNRQYPKEEGIHQKDLASLRNHHDLLCTLYWAAPPEQRPPLSLLQDLVITDHSHKEAVLINLRAWGQISRFLFMHSADSENFKPLLLWQSEFFSKLCYQYLETEKDVRQQAVILERVNKQFLPESQIRDTIKANMASTASVMLSFMSIMANNVKLYSTTFKTGDAIKQTLMAMNCGM